jgi:hypothetical protein
MTPASAVLYLIHAGMRSVKPPSPVRMRIFTREPCWMPSGGSVVVHTPKSSFVSGVASPLQPLKSPMSHASAAAGAHSR